MGKTSSALTDPSGSNIPEFTVHVPEYIVAKSAKRVSNTTVFIFWLPNAWEKGTEMFEIWIRKSFFKNLLTGVFLGIKILTILKY